MRISLEFILGLFIVGILGGSIYSSLDSITRCSLIYGRSVCDFQAVKDMSDNPSISDFNKMMTLCSEMDNTAKRDECFEFIAKTFALLDIERAYRACDEIKEFDNKIIRGDCYNEIKKYLPEVKEEFCGWSTFGDCLSDFSCITGGCSGQVCQSKDEGSVMTTCEYRDCYNNRIYALRCKCIDNKCQWSD
jgi:eight-cysteine-cluster-containing protein